MIRCVVFDFDGTLVDSNEIKRRAFFEALRPFDPSGACVGEALAAPESGDRFHVMRTVAEALARAGRLPDDRSPAVFAEALAAEYGRICEQAIADADEIPGAAETLAWLSARGATLFVSSATPQAALERVVSLRGLGHWFDALHGRPVGKAEHLTAIAARTGAAPGELLMVGDGEDDRQAALAFGCAFAGVVRGPSRRFAADPEHEITDLHALRRLWDRIGGVEGTALPGRSGGETRVAARSH